MEDLTVTYNKNSEGKLILPEAKPLIRNWKPLLQRGHVME